MEFLSDFHFLRPWWFVAIVPLAVALWLLAKMQSGEKSWETICDRHLLPHILIGRDTTSSKKFMLALAAAIGAVSILALAGPAAEKQQQQVFENESALVVVFDLSRSMNAVDIPPSRLVRARYKISDLINRYQSGGQFALVTYAADAFTVMPLTDDTAAFEMYLSSLNSGMLPEQGSRPDLALEHSAALVEQAGLERGDILLVSDYVDSDRSHAMAKDLAQRGYRISVLGVGSKEGAPIRVNGNIFTHNGKTVVAHFDAAPLRELAKLGNGIYRQLDPTGESDIAALNELFESAPKLPAEDGSSQVFGEAWKEQGPWLVLLLLPLAALGFRRGLLVAALAITLPLPQPATANWWDDLWQRGDQQAMEAFEKGDTETAAELFDDPRWRAASSFRSGNYRQAQQALEKPQSAGDWYNLGNAQAHGGNFEGAIKSYKRSIELDPAMEDAQHNMGIVRQLLQEQQAQAGEGDEEDAEGEEAEGQQGEAEQQDGSEAEQAGQADSSGDENDPDDASEQEAGKEEQEQADSGAQGNEEQEQSAADEQDDEEAQTGANEGETMPEDKQAIEQWLRQVEDNPSRMLQRKFRYQQRKENKNTEEGENPW